MARTCRSGRHSPAQLVVWNCGFRFSTCVRCGHDIVGAGYEPWSLPPAGTRVAWRAAPARRYLMAKPRTAAQPSRGRITGSTALMLRRPTLLDMIGGVLFFRAKRGRRLSGRPPGA